MQPATWTSRIAACKPPSTSRRERLGNCVESSIAETGLSASAEATSNIRSTGSEGTKRLVERWPEGILKETLMCSTSAAGSSGILAGGSSGAASATGSVLVLAGALAALATAPAATPAVVTPLLAALAPLLVALPAALLAEAEAVAATGAGAGAGTGTGAAEATGIANLSRNPKRNSADKGASFHLRPSQDFTHRPVRGSTAPM
mmetsp:Transcript_101733/g.217846  ORF Transcript_101733/g.217846 Transcript_101733/m.217846 type:complete len:204 (-) Transcript_101733:561-1172(-)